MYVFDEPEAISYALYFTYYSLPKIYTLIYSQAITYYTYIIFYNFSISAHDDICSS